MQECWESIDLFGCALMRAPAETACLPLPWLHLKAILIVWLLSFVQAHHFLNLSRQGEWEGAVDCAHAHQCS
jgi:hypothetical protein